MYILVPLIIIIWGILFYRLYLLFFPSETLVITQGEIIIANTNTSFKKDTFNLIDNYRDPFLGKRETSVEKPEKLSLSVPVNIGKKTNSLQWPSVSYTGMVKKEKSILPLAFIHINGNEHLVRQGDKIEGILLKKVYKDSIEVVFEKEKKVISK